MNQPTFNMPSVFRRIKSISLFFILYSLFFAIAGCKKDSDSEATIVFPETQAVTCNAGETKTITFDAPAAWRLTSSEMWCRFVQGGEELYSVAGAAGSQTVTIRVSDEGIDHQRITKAQLSLYISGRQGVLAEVSRSAAGFQLEVFDAEGNPVEAVSVGYDDYVTFSVKANFAFAATAQPTWAELRGGSMTGAPDQLTEGALRIVRDGNVEKYENEGVLTFQDMQGKASFSVRVVYDGMDRQAIAIGQPDGNPWNWTVSPDGKTWKHDGSEYGDVVSASISAYHDDYALVAVEERDGDFVIDGAEGASVSWLHFNDRTGRITADASESVRKGYLFAFPRALYDAIKGDLRAALVTVEEGRPTLTYRYQQNNLVICVRQEKTGGGGTGDEVGFQAVCFDENWEMVTVDCLRITDTAILDHCEEIIGTREVFLLDYRSPRGHFDWVTPIPKLTTMDSWGSELSYFVDNDGNRIESMEAEPFFSDTDNPPSWNIMGCINSETPIILVMLNKDLTVMKALYIKTKQ